MPKTSFEDQDFDYDLPTNLDTLNAPQIVTETNESDAEPSDDDAAPAEEQIGKIDSLPETVPSQKKKVRRRKVAELDPEYLSQLAQTMKQQEQIKTRTSNKKSNRPKQSMSSKRLKLSVEAYAKQAKVPQISLRQKLLSRSQTTHLPRISNRTLNQRFKN